MTMQTHRSVFALLCCSAALIGCTPTVKVATDEPITINLNINIGTRSA